MAEEVQTGGVMKFQYSKGVKGRKLDEAQKQEIREGYAKAEERKRREKRRRLMIILLIIIIVVGGLLGIFLR